MLTLDDIINIDWETIRIFGLHLTEEIGNE